MRPAPLQLITALTEPCADFRTCDCSLMSTLRLVVTASLSPTSLTVRSVPFAAHTRTRIDLCLTDDFVPISHMKVLTPLHTDPVPEAADKEAKTNAAFADVGPWLERQKDDVVQPRFSKVIAALKADSAEKLGMLRS